MYPVHQKYFFEDIFDCKFEGKNDSILIVSPKEKTKVDLIDWITRNQSKVAMAMNEIGQLVFSGFNLTKADFSKAFTAMTGMPPQPYKGDTPRDVVENNIYKSTAVSKAHKIPLHQEGAGLHRKNMPEYISFFCVIPPKPGTGQTLIGDVRAISKKIQTLMPDFWNKITTKKLTYVSRYLPKDHWRSRWIRWFNPSHATIEKRFGTEDRNKIKQICEKEGLVCDWDGDWAVISRKGVPGIIDRDGETLFCNSIHLDKFNSELCGKGIIGKIKYFIARLILYPTTRSMQFDVTFDDGTPIKLKDAEKLLQILREHQIERDWKEGDLMLLKNAWIMHGKNEHDGNRDIHVAMS